MDTVTITTVGKKIHVNKNETRFTREGNVSNDLQTKQRLNLDHKDS